MLGDLVGKFARWRKDEAEERRRLIEERLKNWERKCSGLSGACLCKTNEIATGQGERN